MSGRETTRASRLRMRSFKGALLQSCATTTALPAVRSLTTSTIRMSLEKLSSNKSWGGAIQKFKAAKSDALGGLDTQFNVFVPSGSGPFPVLYYLAGLTCTEGGLAMPGPRNVAHYHSEWQTPALRRAAFSEMLPRKVSWQRLDLNASLISKCARRHCPCVPRHFSSRSQHRRRR